MELGSLPSRHISPKVINSEEKLDRKPSYERRAANEARGWGASIQARGQGWRQPLEEADLGPWRKPTSGAQPFDRQACVLGLFGPFVCDLLVRLSLFFVSSVASASPFASAFDITRA